MIEKNNIMIGPTMGASPSGVTLTQKVVQLLGAGHGPHIIAMPLAYGIMLALKRY
jgi:hypothetical protein